MAFIAEMQPTGLFVMNNEVGRPLFDGAFRGDLPWSLKLKTLNMISEAPAMLVTLKVIRSEIDAIIHIIADQLGGGTEGMAAARKDSPRLFTLKEALDEQIARAEDPEHVPA